MLPYLSDQKTLNHFLSISYNHAYLAKKSQQVFSLYYNPLVFGTKNLNRFSSIYGTKKSPQFLLMHYNTVYQTKNLNIFFQFLATLVILKLLLMEPTNLNSFYQLFTTLGFEPINLNAFLSISYTPTHET